MRAASGRAAAGAALAGRTLDEVWSLAASPDGLNLYSVSSKVNAMGALIRTRASGKLAPLPGRYACFIRGGGFGCPEGRGLTVAVAVTVSPDGRNVYVASEDAYLGGLAIFRQVRAMTAPGGGAAGRAPVGGWRTAHGAEAPGQDRAAPERGAPDDRRPDGRRHGRHASHAPTDRRGRRDLHPFVRVVSTVLSVAGDVSDGPVHAQPPRALPLREVRRGLRQPPHARVPAGLASAGGLRHGAHGQVPQRLRERMGPPWTHRAGPSGTG